MIHNWLKCVVHLFMFLSFFNKLMKTTLLKIANINNRRKSIYSDTPGFFFCSINNLIF